jgi:hypothetical protein
VARSDALRARPALDYNGLKTAWKLLTSDCGGLEATASCTRVGKSQIALYGDVTSETFPPADVLLDVEAVAGLPRVTTALAGAQGYRLVPLVLAEDSALGIELGRLTAQFGELLARATPCLRGEEPSAADRTAMLALLTGIVSSAESSLSVLSPRPGRRVDLSAAFG